MASSDSREFETDSDYDPDEEFAEWPKNRNHTSASESENESDVKNEELIKEEDTEAPSVLKKLTHNLIQEIYKMTEEQQDITYRNALEINKEMQKKLFMIREQIQTLLNRIKSRYAQNEERLIANMSKKKKSSIYGKFMKGRTFLIRGSTFFRDENMRNCPNNEDYIERRKQGEIFPMDFDLVARHIWSLQDKCSIVKGIKEQILSERSLNISDKNVQLAKLLEEVGPDFQIDWIQISTHYLSYRHSPTSCKAMWEVYLHPSLKHDAFSESENERLIKAVEKYNYQDWGSIAKEVGKRSDYQCFLQYHTSIVYRGRWLRWDKKDDSRLLAAIEASRCNGIINWSQVAFKFPQKSKAALQQRYQYAINPKLSHEPFSAEEDLLLIAAVKEYGSNFAKIPRTLFPNRSIIQLRQRYNNTIRHRDKIAPWTLEDDKILMEFVKEHGVSSWKKCSEAFENRHTRISCRQRYTVIQKHLSKNSNCTLEQLPRKPRHVVRRSDITPTNWQQKVEELRNIPIELQEDAAVAGSSKETQLTRHTEIKSEQGSTVAKGAKKRKREQLFNNEVSSILEFEKQNPQKKLSTVDIAQLCTKSDMMKSARQNSSLSKNSTEQDGNTSKELLQPKTRMRKRLIYLERLRANGLRYHIFFKFAYNFQFGREPVLSNVNYMEEIKKAMECLGCQMPKNPDDPTYNITIEKDQSINGLLSPIERRQKLRSFLKDQIQPGSTLEPSTECKLPPNFSTLVALRAICALSADYAKTKEQDIKNDTENEFQTLTVKNVAVDRFRQRFRNMFYKAAVLSRFPPSSLENQNLLNHSEMATPCYRISMCSSLKPSNNAENPMVMNDECSDEFENLSSLAIKTEIHCEPYKETNPRNGYS